MAVDRIADFILGGIKNRFPYPAIDYNRKTRMSIDTIIERDFTKNIIEIPAFLFPTSIGTLETMLTAEDGERNKIINSVLISDYEIERKQINTIFKDCTLVRGENKMVRIKNKDNIYFGWPGIITDEDFNTIICLKIRIKIEENKAKATDYICYISPSVFANQDGIVEKTIYKKIIPFCSSYILHNNDSEFWFSNYSRFFKYDWEGKHIEVVIKDGEECFLKANTPLIADFQSDEVIKDILLDNLYALI